MNAVGKIEFKVEQPSTNIVVAKGIVTTIGVQGPAGLNGAPGGSVFEFTQSSPSATWTVNHNLGRRPSVSVLSLGGVELWAEVVHFSMNQVLVYFDQAQTGLVICS